MWSSRYHCLWNQAMLKWIKNTFPEHFSEKFRLTGFWKCIQPNFTANRCISIDKVNSQSWPTELCVKVRARLNGQIQSYHTRPLEVTVSSCATLRFKGFKEFNKGCENFYLRLVLLFTSRDECYISDQSACRKKIKKITHAPITQRQDHLPPPTTLTHTIREAASVHQSGGDSSCETLTLQIHPLRGWLTLSKLLEDHRALTTKP